MPRLIKLTDHPKIAISEADYERIEENLRLYQGKTEMVHYKNTYGEERKREKIQLNMPKVSARRLASLIFNENVTFSIDENKLADEKAHEIFDFNGFDKTFEGYLESCLALGGLAMRPYFEDGHVKIAYIQAPSFLPLQTNVDKITECCIVTRTIKVEGNMNVYYTLLEFHEREGDDYVITSELYQSKDSTVIGDPISLANLYPNLEEKVTVKDLKSPLFVYLKPFGFNNKSISSPLGLSIFDNAKPTIEQLNETYDQFYWEIKMGQRRVAIPETLASPKPINVRKSNGEFSQRMVEFFDPDQNIFVALTGSEDESGIKDLTTDIRTQEYISALNHLLRTYEMELALSAGTFSFDGDKGIKTATEVVSENSMTYQTRNSHLSNVEEAIKELIIACLELAQGNNDFDSEIPDKNQINLNFDDGVFLDKNSQFDFYVKALSAGLISKQYGLEKLFPDADAETMLKQIRDENPPSESSLDSEIYSRDTA